MSSQADSGGREVTSSKEMGQAPSPELRRRPPVVVPALLVLLLVLGAGFLLLSAGTQGDLVPGTASQGAGITVGSPAPDFSLVDAGTGKSVTLQSFRGRPVWVNFWATWCPSCKTELPHMQQALAKHSASSLAIVGIDEREAPATVRDYVKAGGYTWTFLVDPDGAVTNRFAVGGIPEHIFIDAKGIVRDIYIGELQPAQMEEYLTKILPAQAR